MSKLPTIDELYIKYVKSCTEFNIKPSPKEKIFAEQIAQLEKNNNNDIATISKNKKPKAPVLSKTAKEALEKPLKKAKLKPKKIKPIKAKRILLTEKQKIERKRARARLYYQSKKQDDVSKDIDALQKMLIVRTGYAPLTPDNLAENKKIKRKIYHIKNREKRAKYNEEYRKKNTPKTDEEIEVSRAKRRQYRLDNIDKERASDRARKEKRKQYYKDHPKAHEAMKARCRKIYQDKMENPIQKKALLEKWKKDASIKREKNKK